MITHYKLVDKKIVTCSLMDWAQYMEEKDRHIGSTDIGDYWVSTVFLGLDHSWRDEELILFETMIFPNCEIPHDYFEYFQTRCSTYEEAMVMHGRSIGLVKKHYTINKFNAIIKTGILALFTIGLYYITTLL